jgi:hypothetical protein
MPTDYREIDIVDLGCFAVSEMPSDADLVQRAKKQLNEFRAPAGVDAMEVA